VVVAAPPACKQNLAPMPTLACIDHPADHVLVFSTPFTLYQNSSVDPVVRLGSLSLHSFRTSMYLCSYPDGDAPEAGLEFLFLPPNQKSRYVAACMLHTAME
jgi:hypothetical protein